MAKQRSMHLNRRVLLALTGVMLVAVLSTGGWLLYQQHNHRASVTGQSAAGPVLLRPSGARSQYTNAAFGYILQYPAEWGLNVSDEEAYMNVYVRLAQGGPGLPGFEIICAANPTGLTAQQWWHTHAAPANHEMALGPVTLASGTPAYKSTGQGSQPYELYTMVHGDKACQLLTLHGGSSPMGSQATHVPTDHVSA